MVGASSVSDILGLCSIACWLGAQFPQILENIRRQSCEGIALPFLANWLLGDVSNLLGCILTNQLPFQTWLATYFVSVDCLLVIQFVYYYPKQIPPTVPAVARRTSVDRGASRYRTMSAVAANVAAAAMLAAHQEEHHSNRATSRGRRRYGTISHPPRVSSRTEEIGDGDNDGLAALADSFHSEVGKRVSWSIERLGRTDSNDGRHKSATPNAQHLASTESLLREVEALHRGCPSEREELQTDGEGSANRRNSRASRKGATMVFLGAAAIFGIGQLTGGDPLSSSSSLSGVGRVISSTDFHSVPVAVSMTTSIPEQHITPYIAAIDLLSQDLPPQDTPSHDPHSTSSSNKRILGRIFAWLCTTLYLTSRLPQIWKNYDRKSVEGLSMFLFVFAFLGNTFYVASILLSPEIRKPLPISNQFIKESIPYLLGSAGTLMFDVTIVTQSFIYRARPKKYYAARGQALEEEAGLLAADALRAHQEMTTNASDSAVASETRGRTL